MLLLLWVSLLPTFIGELLRMNPLEPIYIYLRFTLYFAMIWALSGLFSRQEYLRSFLVGATFGVLFTSTIAVSNSLPTTGPWVRANIFSMDILKPVSTKFVSSSSNRRCLSNRSPTWKFSFGKIECNWRYPGCFCHLCGAPRPIFLESYGVAFGKQPSRRH